MAIVFRQWVNAFDSKTEETGCIVTGWDVPSSNVISATIASADDTHDRATGNVTTQMTGFADAGKYRGYVTVPTYTPTSTHAVIDILNAAAGAVVEIFLDSTQLLKVFSASNLIHTTGINTSSGQTLVDGQRYLIEFEWQKNDHLKLWVDGTQKLNLVLASATGDAVAVEARVGIDHYDGADTNGFTFVHDQVQIGNALTDTLLDPWQPKPGYPPTHFGPF